METEVQKLLNQVSMQKEFDFIKRLGGKVFIIDNKVIIHAGIIPKTTADIFANRIRKLDPQNILLVNVQ